MINKITNYLKDVKLEMRKVEWPTRKEWIRHTIMVIAITLIVAVILSVLDIIFTGILRNII